MLNKNDELSLDYLKNAYKRDKTDGFQPASDQSKFSTSVVDIFTQINQCFDVMKKLDCPDSTVRHAFMRRFSQTISKVLLTYAEIVKSDFHQYVTRQELACILMNNIQQMRIQLEKIYEAMGGDAELPDEVRESLNELQNVLNSDIDALAEQFAVAGFTVQISAHVRECGRLLQKLRNTDQHAAQSQIEREAEL